MNNVSCIAWRIPCPGFRSWSLLPPNQPLLRSTCGEIRRSPWRPFNVHSRSFASQTSLCPGLFSTNTYRKSFPSFAFPLRSFKSFRGTRNEHSIEHGVRLRNVPFSATEINAIFGGGNVTPSMGNRVLAVLQGRRIAGTLDLDLPADIRRSVHQSSIDAALGWLRANYVLDEDAAIIARIEREEREEEERLIRRAEQLGLYKPQSGSYGAELGENNDVSGKSTLKEMRKHNEAKRLAEEEKQRREWLEGEARDREKLKRQIERSTALQTASQSALTQARPRADPRERPLLAWIQKHHLRATNLDVDAWSMSTSRRLLPSLALAILTIGLCYAYSQNYQPPTREERMWPDTPPAAATIFAIMGINLGIFLLWKFPPAWRMLNRHFISSPLYPYAPSMVGTIFSHQSATHLLMNACILFIVGTKLHDEIGRGDFLAIYMASGVFGSFASLAAHVLAGRLSFTSLGASGAICGIVAAWMMMHANDRFTLFLVPPGWEDTLSLRGIVMLAALVGFELFSIAAPFILHAGMPGPKFTRLDHWAHLGGYIGGAASALVWRNEMQKDRLRRRNSWFERFFKGK